MDPEQAQQAGQAAQEQRQHGPLGQERLEHRQGGRPHHEQQGQAEGDLQLPAPGRGLGLPCRAGHQDPLRDLAGPGAQGPGQGGQQERLADQQAQGRVAGLEPGQVPFQQGGADDDRVDEGRVQDQEDQRPAQGRGPAAQGGFPQLRRP